MKGFRFITNDDTSEFCHRVTEAISNGWKLYGEPKMTFDKKRGVMRCAQALDVEDVEALAGPQGGRQLGSMH